jgi:hypothetical protein
MQEIWAAHSGRELNPPQSHFGLSRRMTANIAIVSERADRSGYAPERRVVPRHAWTLG